jgi:hypothetical protein
MICRSIILTEKEKKGSMAVSRGCSMPQQQFLSFSFSFSSQKNREKET